jgi:hypothetical protein
MEEWGGVGRQWRGSGAGGATGAPTLVVRTVTGGTLKQGSNWFKIHSNIFEFKSNRFPTYFDPNKAFLRSKKLK